MEEFKIDPSIAYDIVELPSRGIYYKNNKKSVRVAYLTANDENILSSQNLISNGLVIDELIKRKVLDKDINVDDIVEEDRQAILIFLRNTAFGTEYNLSLTDPKTGKEFSITIDLSELKFKDFNLKPNEHNEYDYVMTKSNTKITFKFLEKKQEEEIDNLRDNWNGNGIAPVITKQLEFMIKSVNGERDIMKIYQFIQQLPIKDSQEFRRYVNDNKPGLDLKRNVLTPSGENIQINIGFGVEFFRYFYGL